MKGGAEILADVFDLAMQPDLALTVSEWADAHRVLDTVSSAKAGPWRTSHTPYLRQLMDWLSPSDPCWRVVLKIASQLGKSEVGLNFLGRAIHLSPGPGFIVLPSIERAEEYSKGRLDRMIESTPVLRARIRPAKSRDGSNTMHNKQFPGGMLYMRGANVPASLASTPVRYAHCDEIDRYKDSAGVEGDPVELVIQRMKSFANCKLLETSTPTIKGASKIDDDFHLGDQCHFWVPCPDCGKFQVLQWRHLRWPKGRPLEARYMCEHCGVLLEDRHKNVMLPLGEWRANAPEHALPCCPKPNPNPDPGVHSAHLSGLYTPHGWRDSWPALAHWWDSIQGQPENLKVFVNTVLAEPWDPYRTETISADHLVQRAHERVGTWRDERGELHEDAVPDEVAILTCAVDTQDDRLELEVVGWGRGEEAWSIDYRVIDGDPAGPRIWQELDEYLSRTWTTAAGWPLTLAAVCIDSGGHHRDAVCKFVKDKRSRRIWAIKGDDGNRPIWDTRPRKAGEVKIIGVDTAKELLYHRLRVSEPGPGYCHFPAGRELGYFRQLTAERMEVVRQGGQQIVRWKLPQKARNEALDCRVYNIAALRSWTATGNKLEVVLDKRQARPEPASNPGGPRPASTAPAKPGEWLAGVPGGEWLDP